jgi:hypothetical protein
MKRAMKLMVWAALLAACVGAVHHFVFSPGTAMAECSGGGC